MTFVAGWALAGLVLLGPLVLLHLRGRARPVREVPSLLLWHDSKLDAMSAARRLRPPPLPLLLALQLIALIILVVALAAPVLDGAERRPETVVVLDDSFWMTAPGAMADARREVDRAIGSTSPGSPVRIVLAGGTPSVIYRGTTSGASAAVARVRATPAPADISRALTVAAGLLTGPRDRVILVRAAQDGVPALRASPGELKTLVAGAPVSDQGIFNPTARCGIGTTSTCEVVATVANSSPSSDEVRVVVAGPGHPDMTLSTLVGARGSTHIHFLTAPGEQVTLRLVGADSVSIDNQAWVTVPGDDDIPRAAVVTVIGTPADALSLAQAFAAVPGVTLRLETPAGYRASAARGSDLVVLDGGLPRGQIPPAAAVMLVDPDRLPGGHVAGSQTDPALSGIDLASPLLEDADLSSLTVDTGAARQLTLPQWLSPVLWSASGPLLAAGDNGHGRTVVTAFQPGGSTLAQNGAFPVLAANIVRWSLGWVPESAPAGSPISIDALPGARNATLTHDGATVDRVGLGATASEIQAPGPGVYTLAETGPGVSHQATVDVNLDGAVPSSAVPADIRTAHLRSGRAHRTPLTPWLLAVALVVLALEWAYWATRGQRIAV